MKYEDRKNSEKAAEFYSILINEYAEKHNPSNQSDERFEPREEQKGNTARAMFYFYAMYSNVADDEFFELQKETLMNWHYYDAADEIETERTWEIAQYQDGLPNPFVLDSTLAGRIWYPQSNLLVVYNGGWNLVGLPLSVDDNSYQTQFLDAVSGTLYGYNLVYNEETYLDYGRGYWLMINNNSTNIFTGNYITELNISLNEGWNLVAGLSSSVELVNIIDVNGIIIEGKGQFVTSDRKKHRQIRKEFGSKYDIRFVFSNSKTKIGKKSNTTYANWCERYGFKYSDKEIPQSWIEEKKYA